MFRDPAACSSWPVLAACLSAISLLGCTVTPNAKTPAVRESPWDVHSHSRPEDVRVTHVDLDLTVNFEERRLAGRATLKLSRRVASAPAILDVKALKVRSVLSGSGAGLSEASWRLERGTELLGDALVVRLGGNDDTLAIDYETTPAGTGLLWLDPLQTAGKKHPYLFSQSQAIHARTWFPCQDTPAVRMTYTATVKASPELLAVMSAERISEDPARGVYRFSMPQPIPSYLVALAVGDLAFRPLGPRSGVYTEPSLVDAAAWEFADTERMIAAVEKLYGPYRWGRFDILVLPPSFPAGGMENPRLTFVSPTLLAGDRSLVNTIAHELAHSWSGNLVTNATWSDVWLNEGFTTYLEQRIIEALFGVARLDMEGMLSVRDLKAELRSLKPADQALRVSLTADRDPDDAFTGVPYTKGALFLRHLERTFGRDAFDAFLKSYFERNAFQTVTSDGFLSELNEGLLSKNPVAAAKAKLDEWLNGPGLPADAPLFTSEALDRIDAQIAVWKAGRKATEAFETKAWTTQEWVHFVQAVGDTLPHEKLGELDETFRFTASGNAEINLVWLKLCIQSGYHIANASVRAKLQAFLTTVGRPRLIKPLYKALAKTKDGMALARGLLKIAKPGYHKVAIREIEDVLAKAPST